MTLAGLRLAVAGAGVFGLAIAVRAARLGAEVELFEPRRLGDNASGVAAGMLAPALEAAAEDAASGRYDLYQRGYAAWPAFARACGLAPPAQLEAGALYVGDPPALATLEARLDILGAHTARLDAAQARARQPLYGAAADALWVAADGRVDPATVLGRLRTAFLAAGGRWRREALAPRAPQAEAFDAVVLAAGFESAAWADRAPELEALSPVKGHILHYPLTGAGGPTLRGAGGYVAALADGVAFGATMEAGRSDRSPDPATAEAMHRRAVALVPALGGLAYETRVGVRAATPDGAPMVGRTAGGVVVATGARRNGWLLAPLAAEAALAALQGAPPDPAFDPARFDC